MCKLIRYALIGLISGTLPLYASLETDKLLKAYRGFEPNYGQITDFEGNTINDIIFSAKVQGLHLFFKKDGVSYVIYSKKGEELNTQLEDINPINILKNDIPLEIEYARVDLELVGGNIDRTKIVFEDELPGYVNYYLPSCPDGIKEVKTYRVVRVKDVYPGIDWVFRYDANGNLHHEFVVKPEGDPERIRLKVKWADVKLKEDGSEVILSTPVGEILDGSIYAYEDDRRVKVSYVIDNGLLAYDVKSWRRKDNLVIDPPLARLWATYYGGSGQDYAYSVTTDSQGNVYVVGWTWSNDFPTYNPGGEAYFQGSYSGGGAYYGDAVILKFNPSGVRLWATYYGARYGDIAMSVTTDQQSNVYVVGFTEAPNFPVYDPGGGAYYQGSNAGSYDAFILKFNSGGIRLWATYYGGSDREEAYSAATDNEGNVYVVGITKSTNFPVYDAGNGAYFQGSAGGGGYYDAFILKFNSSGVRLWATYYGGHNEDIARSVTTDLQGDVYVVGGTISGGTFPLYDPGDSAYFDGTNYGGEAFILKFNSSGIRLWATYYGGSTGEEARSVATDPQGNVYVIGSTYSSDFPVYNPGGGAYFQGNNSGSYNGDAFILKFNSNCVRLWATYYWGSNGASAYSVTTDPQGNVYVVGSTVSLDFPVYDPGGGAYFQGSIGGGTSSYPDAFILKFNSSGVRLWATYYGGSMRDESYYVTADPDGNVYMVGLCRSNDFPVYDPGDGAYFQGNNAGVWDIFIVKFESNRPHLISPANNSFFNSTYIHFVWDYYQVNGYKFEIQIANTPTFNNAISYEVNEDTTFNISFMEGVCYWRVRAVNLSTGESSFWSEVWQLTIDLTPPTVPILASPENNAYLKDSSVYFIWNSSTDTLAGLKDYIIQYDINSSFTNPTTITINDSIYQATLTDNVYYWRVSAVDSAGNISNWSEVWSFEVDTRAPNTPLLVTPVEEFLNNNNVTFVWTSVTKLVKLSKDSEKSPIVYEFYLDTTSTFDTTDVRTLEDTTITLTLEEAGYYWRVRARDIAGNIGDYSSVANFIVDITPPVIESVTVWHDTLYMGPFTITAKVTDNLSGVNIVKFSYYRSSDDTNWVEAIMNYDENAGKFEGEIPPVSNVGDTVRYYITASDNAGNEVTDPLDAPNSYYSFIVITPRVSDNHITPSIRVLTKGNSIVLNIKVPSESPLTVNFYDISGRLVYGPISRNIPPGETKLEPSISKPGIYFYEVETPYLRKQGKVLLVK